MDSGEAFQCDQCPKVFGTLGKYNQHLKTHSKPYPCAKCDLCFALRADLTRHIHARHRVGQSKYPCIVPNCDFKATRKDNIRQHLQKSHPTHLYTPVPRGQKKRQVVSPLNLAKIVVHVGNTQPLSCLSTMMQAASTGNIGLLEVTLKLGADLSIRADDGSTALHCAVKTGQREMIRYLLQAGASTEAQNFKGKTPLHEAVQSRDQGTFALLIQSGAAVSPSVLDDLIKDGQVELFRIAIARVGEALLRSCDQHIFMTASKFDQTAIMLILLSLPHFDRDWVYQFGGPTVHIVVSQGHTEILKCLMTSESIDPDQCAGLNGATLLHLAAARGQTDVADVLLSYKDLKVNATDDYGCTPLHKAAAAGKTEVVRGLLRRPDIKVNEADYIGQTPLQKAVCAGASDVVELLLRTPDIDANIPDRKGATLLHLAAQRGRLSTLKLLVKNEKILFKNRDTLLQEAVWNLRWEVVDFLLDLHDNKVTVHQNNDALRPPHGSEAVIERLLQHEDFSVTKTDRSGQNLLHKAAKLGASSVIAQLLTLSRIDMNLLDRKGWSALHCAAASGQLEALESLLKDERIDIDIVKWKGGFQYGFTALDLARLKGFTAIISMLEGFGAKSFRTNANNVTRMDNAVVVIDDSTDEIDDLNDEVDDLIDNDKVPEYDEVPEYVTMDNDDYWEDKESEMSFRLQARERGINCFGRPMMI